VTQTLALVESPTQLLNVVEWAHLTDGSAVHVAVLPPRDVVSLVQLAEMSLVARRQGMTVSRYDVRGGLAGRLAAASALVPRVVAADRLVIGDPFSRTIQALLPLARTRRMVVVDDGTATLEYAACVAQGRPLVRWRHAGVPPRSAVRATRLLSPRAGRSLTVFSALSGTAPSGSIPMDNRFAWTRASATPDILPGAVDIVGASLVESGVVDYDSYLGAVAQLAHRRRATRYLAHRREDIGKLRELEKLTGLAVLRPRVPLELFLRRGPVAETVITFPSTIAHTLPVVLADTAVAVQVHEVQPAWFATDATERSREFVHRVTSSARTRHAMQIA
jgi:hypothetical protein